MLDDQIQGYLKTMYSRYFESGELGTIIISEVKKSGSVNALFMKVIEQQVPENLLDWFRENVYPRLTGGHSIQLIPFLKRAADQGEPFHFVRKADYGAISADHGLFWGVSGFSVDDPHRLEKYGIVGGIMGLQNLEERVFQNTGDSVFMTAVEIDTRKYIVEFARFLKRFVPGFEPEIT